jgi:hypothetical protein
MSEHQLQLKVGDTVHWTDVNFRDGGLRSDKVTKIGSKLVTVGRMVFRLDTLATNDDYRHQMLVLDVQAYKDEQTARKLSRVLSDHLLRGKVSLQKLLLVAETLGVSV